MISRVAAILGLFIFHLLRPKYVKSLFYNVMDVRKLDFDKSQLIARPMEGRNAILQLHVGGVSSRINSIKYFL